jgi:hypothetical protein
VIDTLRFKIYIDNETKALIEKNSIEKKEVRPKPTWKSDLDSQEEIVDDRKRVFFSKPYVFGSNYQFYVSLYKDNLYIEFSAPKVMYGSNIYMLYPDKLSKVLKKVAEAVEAYHSVKLPDPTQWILQRLDICYAWRFSSEEEAQKVLVSLSSYEIPRKKKTIIGNESLIFYGTTCKIKFYLKQPEYKAHSVGRLGKFTFAYTNAHKMLDACKGILRFEVTMKKKQIQQDFGKNDSGYLRIDYDSVETMLKNYLSQLVKSGNFKSKDLSEIYSKLEARCGKKQALNLFQFFNTWFCEDKTREKLNRNILDSKMCASTIRKRLDLLKSADVGIITTGKDTNFDLSIPSNLAVNSPTSDVMGLLPKFEYPKKKHGDVKD